MIDDVNEIKTRILKEEKINEVNRERVIEIERTLSSGFLTEGTRPSSLPETKRNDITKTPQTLRNEPQSLPTQNIPKYDEIHRRKEDRETKPGELPHYLYPWWENTGYYSKINRNKIKL